MPSLGTLEPFNRCVVGEGFPKRCRLRKRREFLRVQQCSNSRKFHAQHFLVVVASRFTVGTDAAADDWGRVGITVSKRVGNAVTRNRIKRWVREFVRGHSAWVPTRCDIVIIAKRSAASIDGYAGVEADLLRFERRLSPC